MAQSITKKARLKKPGDYFGQPGQKETATLQTPGTWSLRDIEQITGSTGKDCVFLSATGRLTAKVNLGKGQDQLWLDQGEGFELRVSNVEFIGARTGSEGATMHLSGKAVFLTDGSLNLSVATGDKAAQAISLNDLRADTTLNLGAGKDTVTFGSGFSLGLNAQGELLARKDGHTLTFVGYATNHSQLTLVIDGASHTYRDLLTSGALNSPPSVHGASELGSVPEGGESLQFLTGDLLRMVSDDDGDPLQIVDVWLENPQAGSLTHQEDGTWLLQPALGFRGEVAVAFQVTDGVNTPVLGRASARVTEVEDFAADLLEQAQTRSINVAGIQHESLADAAHPSVRALDVSLGTPEWKWHGDITYSFNLEIPQYYLDTGINLLDWRAYPESLWTATHDAMQALDELIDLGIEFRTQGGDIRFNQLNTDPNNGYAYHPADYYELAGDIFLSTRVGNADPALPGYYGLNTLIHELGHAVGLKHPFEWPDALPSELDHRANTLMSYTDYKAWSPKLGFDQYGNYWIEYQGIFAESFMVYDVAALQYMYGPETTTRTGDDTYNHLGRDAYYTLWDAGGIDTLDLTDTTHANHIDLRPGAYSSINYRTTEDWANSISASVLEQLGWVDHAYIRNVLTSLGDTLYTGEQALGIAYGTVIENVMGGPAADTFHDNLADNILWGGAGDDIFLLGGGGFDTVFGGDGFDIVSVPVLRESVTLAQSAGELLMVAEDFAVRMVGIEDIRFAPGGTWA